jgi:hypothetical protein
MVPGPNVVVISFFFLKKIYLFFFSRSEDVAEGSGAMVWADGAYSLA